MAKEFPHKQHAHCENGSLCNLLRNEGVEISEPLVFGTGSGIFFAHMPFIKNQGIPLTSFRILPGKIYWNATKNLGIKMAKHQYKNPQKAMDELDEMLLKGKPVGLLTNLYYLPYFPQEYRFHYNSHNTIIYRKENGHYLVSDPVLEKTTTISYYDLMKARFAKGVLHLKGDMYYPLSIPEQSNIQKAIKKGIKTTINLMIKNPVPYHGITGISFLAKKIRKWETSLDEETLKLFLGNIIRMQEETGTGGAGFRFIYAAFLLEAAKVLKDDRFRQLSENISTAGDNWRAFALHAAKICKDRGNRKEEFDYMVNILKDIAELEKNTYKELKNIISK